MSSLARHLHQFVIETKLTHDEWQYALKLLRWAGDITDEERNEFVLFSDVLGVSSLVDMVHSTPQATSSSVLGPFHVSNAPPRPLGGDMKLHYDGDVVLVEGYVKDTEGNPIAGAEIDIWQTAPNGMYSSQDDAQEIESFHGIFTTDENGWYGFTTVRLVEYTVPSDGPVGVLLNATGRHPWRQSHLHYIVSAPNHTRLVTEVFPDTDPYLDNDTVFGVREDLIMSYVPHPPEDFPVEGFELSGQVDTPFLRVRFDPVIRKIT